MTFSPSDLTGYTRAFNDEINFGDFKVRELDPIREIREICAPRKLPAIRYITSLENDILSFTLFVVNLSFVFSGFVVQVYKAPYMVVGILSNSISCT